MSERRAREVGAARIARWLATVLAAGTLSCEGSSPETREEPCADCDLHADAEAQDDATSRAGVSASTDAEGEELAPSAPVGTGGASSRCGTVDAPLTEAVESAFGIAELRALLVDQPHVFPMQQRISNAYNAPFTEQVTEVELEFELGEFSFHESSWPQQEYCDHVTAPLRIEARATDRSFSFTGKGSLWREEASFVTRIYVAVDSESVTGTFFSAGPFELSFSVFPRHVRGEIYAGGLVFALRPDGCVQHELPLPPDEPVDFLGGRSVAALVEEAEGKLENMGMYDAVWQDGASTTVRVELGHGAESAACAQSELPLITREGSRIQPHLELRVPYAGHLSSGDGRLALPLGELLLAVGTDGSLLAIRGRGTALASDYGDAAGSTRGFGDRLDAHVEFDIASQPARADGTIRVGEMLGMYSWSTIDCVAWPTGGYWDRDDCRYQR